MSPSPIQDYLDSLHARFASLRDGVVADYIPELALADPEWFGICIATHDGHVYEVGDTGQAMNPLINAGATLANGGVNPITGERALA